MKQAQASCCCPQGHISIYSIQKTLFALVIALAGVLLLPADVLAQCEPGVTITANATGTNPSGCGTCDGSASVTASGGTEPYTYLWSTGATSQSIGQGAVSGTTKLIDCGDTLAPYITATNDTFLKDQNFVSGTIFSNNIAIANTTEDGLYQNERYVGNGGFFNYNIPVTNGNYTVELYFAEIFFGTSPSRPGGVGSRIFDVTIENVVVLDDYDIIADAGAPATAIIKSINTTVTDGVLNIIFDGVVNNAKINALRIKPRAATDGICTGDYSVTVTDANGCSAVAEVELSTTSCDDNNACTADACVNNACAYTAVDCNDSNACTDDFCNTESGCFYAPHSCDDSDLCTEDLCTPESGCAHPALNCNDDNACTDDACDSATGCSHLAISCDDSDDCTEDSCNPATGCSNEQIICNDENLCTTDACSEGLCVYTALDCSDGDVCTDDACDNGICSHAEIPGCNDPCLNIICDDEDACTDDVCDEGDCFYTAKLCADDDLCTQDDCFEGNCVNIPDNCDDADACTDDICQGSGFCDHVLISCDDNNACTEDACTEGSCANTSMNCDDSNDCTTDACSAGQCVNTDIDCSDADDCTNDYCEDGNCMHSTIKCEDSDECTDDICFAGQCIHTAIDCSDDNECTDDLCHEGVCSHENATCNDNDKCTTDTCEAGQCISTPLNCDDGDACTADACEEGTCLNTPITCDDNDACTNDACNSGTCSNTAIICDDADICTEDICEEGQCVFTDVICDDGNSCTNDACGAEGCAFSAIVCDDGDNCTEDACDNGQCIYTAMLCDDSDDCTEDACNNGVCLHHLISCNDDDNCTSDACTNGQCAYTQISCDDSDACTNDGCTDGQCTHTLISCDDNDACTTDACNNGCTHTPVVCNDNDGCTLDNCSASAGCTHTVVSCDDGNSCTNDVCANSICTHTNICGTCTLEVVSFTLINSFTDTDIRELVEGDVINLFHNPNINIRANTCLEVIGSVKFNLNGPTYKLESSAPYALAGDNPAGNYNKWNVAPGSYTLTAIPYSGAGATGTQGPAKTITFTVVNQEAVCIADAECLDSDACTDDICQSGVCAHLPVNCNDNDACTIDACSGSCTHTPASCDDSNVCTEDDCNSATGCTHDQDENCCNTASDCDDSDLCTVDACNEHECAYTQSSSGPSYLHVVNSAKSWKKLKLGYSSTSLFIPKHNVVAGGNDQLCITLRGSAGLDWSKIQVRPQGSISAPVALGGYGLGTSFTEICIPLTAFGGNVDFTKLTLIEIPYSNGAGAFEIDIQKIEFRGGATPFLWFGDSKTDNFHDGNTTTALQATLVVGGPCGSASKRENVTATSMSEKSEAALQAYPNPFSDQLTIQFSVAETSDVRLEIYDLTGKRIAILFEGTMQSGEVQKAEFTPAAVAEGMFIYRLQTATGAYMGKALMVK